MIFVSSSCVKANTIKEAIERLYQAGFKNIELSGGTTPYPHLVQDLIGLRSKHGINFLLHNYFPPPPIPFVLNIASLNDKIHQMSVAHIKEAIDLSKQLGIDRYGFHAGFRLDIPLDQVGKKLDKLPLFDEKTAYRTFLETLKHLQAYAGEAFNLYVENNVLSKANAHTYQPANPLFLTCQEDYELLYQQTAVKLLLDVAHLKVSTNVLGLDFEKELLHLHHLSDYIHVSDNDGWFDTNQALRKGSKLYEQLQQLSWENKIITLEVYEEINALISSYENILLIANGH
ncbi:MAG: sugar phosphate isomerase/epimerase family protein [Thermonemataceae bacterium]